MTIALQKTNNQSENGLLLPKMRMSGHMTDWLLWFTVLSSLVRMVLVDSWKCCVENLKIFF